MVDKLPPSWTEVGNGEYVVGKVILVLKLFVLAVEQNPTQETDPQDVIFLEEVIFPEDVIFPVAETLPEDVIFPVELILTR